MRNSKHAMYLAGSFLSKMLLFDHGIEENSDKRTICSHANDNDKEKEGICFDGEYYNSSY